MGTDTMEEVEILPDLSTVKVHHSICTELMKLVDQISKILPRIEAARPGCSSGVQALCHLCRANENSKSFILSCCDSSKLYLAFRGNQLVSRCETWRNMMERSLKQIQNMVPVLLSAEISHMLDTVRSTTFTLDSSEEEAGSALQELVYHNVSQPNLVKSEVEALQISASRLHITSPKALLMEKRSIKKMISKVSDSNSKKRELLVYFFSILSKHGKSMLGETIKVLSPTHKTLNASTTLQFTSESCEATWTKKQELYWKDTSHKSLKTIDLAPEELTCPISMRIMIDPVVIASGQTFERAWIEKWFAEGNSTCPKTKMKLSHLSWTPNTAIKDLISKWCWEHGITVPDPGMTSEEDAYSASFVSLASSFRSLHLPIDMSNVSMDSHGSYCSESEVSLAKVSNLRSLITCRTNSGSPRSQSGAAEIERTDEKLSELPFHSWESQLQIIEEAEMNLKSNDGSFTSISSTSFVETVTRFIKDAYDLHDSKAQKAGFQLLLTFVRERRNWKPKFSEDLYDLLVDLLNSNSTEAVLGIMELLSAHKHCRSKLVASGLLSSLVSFLDSSRGECNDPAVKILYNVCLDNENHPDLVALGPTPKLSSFLRSNSLAKFAIFIMRTLCYLEKVRISIVETPGCISSVAELLESSTHEDQENAAYVLLSLCSQHSHCCQQVLNEGVFSALANICVNGNNKGKTYATELLRLLDHHQDESNPPENNQPNPDICSNEVPAIKAENPTSKAENPTTQPSGFFAKRLSKLSKPSFLALKKKK